MIESTLCLELRDNELGERQLLRLELWDGDAGAPDVHGERALTFANAQVRCLPVGRFGVVCLVAETTDENDLELFRRPDRLADGVAAQIDDRDVDDGARVARLHGLSPLTRFLDNRFRGANVDADRSFDLLRREKRTRGSRRYGRRGMGREQHRRYAHDKRGGRDSGS